MGALDEDDLDPVLLIGTKILFLLWRCVHGNPDVRNLELWMETQIPVLSCCEWWHRSPLCNTVNNDLDPTVVGAGDEADRDPSVVRSVDKHDPDSSAVLWMVTRSHWCRCCG